MLKKFLAGFIAIVVVFAVISSIGCSSNGESGPSSQPTVCATVFGSPANDDNYTMSAGTIFGNVFIGWADITITRVAIKHNTITSYCVGIYDYDGSGPDNLLAQTGIEVSEIFYEEAYANIEKAGLSEYVEMIHGDAAEIVNQLEGPFDFILQDSAKPLYSKLLNKTIELVRVNGIIAADDALFLPMGYEEINAKAIHQYNIMVFNEPRLYSTILPIGDGLTLSVKLRD